MVHKRAEFAQRAHGLRAKQFNEKRFKEKAAMKKTLAIHEEKKNLPLRLLPSLITLKKKDGDGAGA